MRAAQAPFHRHIRRLLQWFARHARDLPWRRTSDPYAIWISEIMLQQTQVQTVIAYWERWMRALPTVQDLAQAAPEQVLKLWEGLGYYRRARHLHQAARLIVDRYQGQFPTTYAEVLALPGIGPYTAGAICSIAFNQATPILDGNVQRVLSRFHGIRQVASKASTQRRLWDLAHLWVTTAAHLDRPARASTSAESHCSHLNQGLMELGALICTPKSPRCRRCPLRSHCAAHRLGLETQLPRLTPRPDSAAKHFSAAVVSHQDLILLRKRPEGSVNGGFWEFPNVEIPSLQTEEATREVLAQYLRKELRLPVRSLRPLGRIRHSITRYRIRLDAFAVILSKKPSRALPASRWEYAKDLHRLPLTSAHRKILRWLPSPSDTAVIPRRDRSAPAGLVENVRGDRARSAPAAKKIREQPSP